jgi:hypothetical protein
MKMNAHALIYLFIILLYSSQIGNSISESVARNDELLNDSMFLDSIASDTWNYLYSANTRSETASLPYSWYSGQNQKVGNFSNPAEIGFYALSWIAAFDLHRPWSPSWTETEENVTKILDQLIAWQNSNNSYKNRVFYQWYWVGSWRSKQEPG